MKKRQFLFGYSCSLFLSLFGLCVFPTVLSCMNINSHPSARSKTDVNVSLRTGLESEPSIAMKTDYLSMFDAAQVNEQHVTEIESIATTIQLNSDRYHDVSDQTGVPWYVIAAIHNLESDLSFSCHLHNGDPLTDFTVHVPKNRPLEGEPPFTWEASAIDALAKSNLWRPTLLDVWTIAQCLEFMERYNGLGYRPHNVNTPYLWSFTNLYSKGMFTSDSVFDANAVSREIGAVSLLKVMVKRGYIVLER